MSIIKDDSRPWSWDCDPCGESGDLFETGEDARQAADEHEFEVEAYLNAHLLDGKGEPTEHPDYQEAECEILIADARQARIESHLIEIRELIREAGR